MARRIELIQQMVKNIHKVDPNYFSCRKCTITIEEEKSSEREKKKWKGWLYIVPITFPS